MSLSKWRAAIFPFLILLLSGCESLTGLLFYPQTQYLQTPQRYALEWKAVELKARDGTRLSNWYLPAEGETRARILFLHGNGENISTHLNAVAWLPAAGYAVFLLDYRGYGQSDGKALLPDVFQDIHAAHAWLLGQNETSPIVLLGQSIGGGLGLSYAGRYRRELPQFDALVIESAPASLPQVAREAMAKHWLTWPLQLPAFLLPDAYDAELNVKTLRNEPILLMHGTEDRIVSIDHLQQLREQLPKATVLTYPDGHIRGFASQSVRDAVTDFMTSEN